MSSEVNNGIEIKIYNFDNNVQIGVYKDNYQSLEAIKNKDFSEEKYGWRLALGGQLNIANGVALRAMYRYISIGGDIIDDMQEFSIGLRFLF